MAALKLFSLFHLNLAFSSIEEEQRPLVIQRCYWPLLRLIRERHLPLGIEATGFTLETIEAIDPTWTAELRNLVSTGACEFIGSGYAQIIGPLVPAEVTSENLRLGNLTYERLLGKHPALVLVNEQAYAAGLLQLYRDAGFKAIIMEWDNPSSGHPEWKSEWQYLPQIACGQHGEEMPLIWNQSVAFQKFQRYAHGEMELDEYLDYLRGHCSDKPRVFSFYGNDAEVFDFRPGRFQTEAPLSQESEWSRIEKLYAALQSTPEFQLISPLASLELLALPDGSNRLCLESAQQPVPVKKQSKYNITRWAVTGRDDLGINTACWRLYEALKKISSVPDTDWRELCYLWSSDFRTHITEKRWTTYRARLAAYEKSLNTEAPVATPGLAITVARQSTPPDDVRIVRNHFFLTVETPAVNIRLNCRRGLALDRLSFPGDGPDWLCGTLPHGYYKDVDWAADYYSGHLLYEIPGKARITDLERVEPEISWIENEGLCVSATIKTPLGTIRKQLMIAHSQPSVSLEYRLMWNQPSLGSLRLGHLTLNPEAFDAKSLFFRTHNGGFLPDTFSLAANEVDHGDAVSFLVSARQGLGVTAGMLQIGDARRAIQVSVDKAQAAVIGMMTCRKIRPSYFLRLSFSGQELDETSRASQNTGPAEAGERSFRMSFSLMPKAPGIAPEHLP